MTAFAVADTVVGTTADLSSAPAIPMILFIETVDLSAHHHLPKLTRNLADQVTVWSASTASEARRHLEMHSEIGTIVFAGLLSNNDETTLDLIRELATSGRTLIGLSALETLRLKMTKAGCTKVLSPWSFVAEPEITLLAPRP